MNYATEFDFWEIQVFSYLEKLNWGLKAEITKISNLYRTAGQKGYFFRVVPNESLRVGQEGLYLDLEKGESFCPLESFPSNYLFQLNDFLLRFRHYLQLKLVPDIPVQFPAKRKFRPKQSYRWLYASEFKGLKVLLKQPQTPWEALVHLRMPFPNLVQCLGRCLHQGTTYLVFEDFGSTLHSFLESNQTYSKKQLALDLVKAVHSVHSKGLVHMNISPWSVFVDSVQSLRLGDFECVGSSCFKENNYTAPEVLVTEAAGAKVCPQTSCDVYSLGAVLYFIETKQHYQRSAFQSLFQTTSNPLLEQILPSMLSANPQLRPTSKEVFNYFAKLNKD